MPQYDFKCTGCEHKLSLVCSMNSYKKLKKCPECAKQTLIRDYEQYGISTVGEPTTLGALADANTKRMIQDGTLDKAKQQEKDRRKPPPSKEQIAQYKEHRKLASMSPRDKQRYIMTGEGL